jgi:hypothetical protein
MRTFWLLFPAGLSALVLSAHFLRRGQGGLALLSLGLVALLFVRRPMASLALRAALFLAALEWLRTLAALVLERSAVGEPWLRLAIILGAVAAVALGGGLLLGTPRGRRHFGGTG